MPGFKIRSKGVKISKEKIQRSKTEAQAFLADKVKRSQKFLSLLTLMKKNTSPRVSKSKTKEKKIFYKKRGKTSKNKQEPYRLSTKQTKRKSISTFKCTKRKERPKSCWSGRLNSRTGLVTHQITTLFSGGSAEKTPQITRISSDGLPRKNPAKMYFNNLSIPYSSRQPEEMLRQSKHQKTC